MSFLRYIRDNYKLFIFYFILMAFILLVIFLDRSNRILNSDIVYIVFVSLLMFVLFILWDYTAKCRYIKKINELCTDKNDAPILPKPQDYKDEVYAEVINNVYNSYLNAARSMEHEFTENNEFMTAWVHEIKTPITTTELIIDNSKCEDCRDLASIKEEIDKIDDYIEKVLYYSRSGDFSKDYIISEEALSSMVKLSVKKHSIIFIRKHIKFVNSIDDKFYVDTDKKWFLFIIDQILSNSLKYTKENGIIKAYAYEDENEKVLVIEDNGSGIKKEDMQRLFTKAFTGSNGRNINMKATGLGLYLSQKLAKKLGHFITCESEYVKGTKIFVHFAKWDEYYIEN